MPSDHENSPAGSDICLKCGICCSGTLFSHGDLSDVEVAIAERAGLDVDRSDGKARFRQPCFGLVGTSCSVYDVRPATCRAYRCKLLKRVQQREVGADEASRLISVTRELESRVHALLPGKSKTSPAQSCPSEDEPDEAASAEQMKANPQLTLARLMLNRMLDRHFRFSNQRKMKDWDTGIRDED